MVLNSVECATPKKKKKKKTRRIVQEEEISADGKLEANPVQDGYKKLEAGRFRCIFCC